jgi:hypothetical protein
MKRLSITDPSASSSRLDAHQSCKLPVNLLIEAFRTRLSHFYVGTGVDRAGRLARGWQSWSQQRRMRHHRTDSRAAGDRFLSAPDGKLCGGVRRLTLWRYWRRDNTCSRFRVSNAGSARRVAHERRCCRWRHSSMGEIVTSSLKRTSFLDSLLTLRSNNPLNLLTFSPPPSEDILPEETVGDAAAGTGNRE